MGLNINDFKGKMNGRLARSNLFNVRIARQGFQDLEFLCKATSIPTTTLGEIQIPYMGRTIKVPGDRTYDDWVITVISTEDSTIRNELEKWSYDANSAVGNVRGDFIKADASIQRLTTTGENMGGSYELKGIWPKVVDAIELGWDTVDNVEEFTTTFAIDWFERADSSTR